MTRTTTSNNKANNTRSLALASAEETCVAGEACALAVVASTVARAAVDLGTRGGGGGSIQRLLIV
jgi:hypothetical protein